MISVEDIPFMSNADLNVAIETAAKFAMNSYGDVQTKEYMRRHLHVLLEVQAMRSSIPLPKEPK